jgi:tungstate transport system ATP-binding protein
VLLLDEPTANLDPYNVGLIEKLIREENANQGMTIVLVTHHIFQARRLAGRTGLLLGGRLPARRTRLLMVFVGTIIS